MISYVVITSMTGASLFSSDYSRFDNERKSFPTIEDALAYIMEKYKGKQKSRIYVDGVDGKPQPVGWIYSFRNADYSHAPVETWNQQDWTEIRKVEETRISF